MNDDKLIGLLSNLDDDLIEQEIDNLMNGDECDMDSIKRKALQKLTAHNKKAKFRKFIPYVAAACICLIGINTVYADEISDVVKSFFHKTPVYSTMVDGSAYYLKDSLKLDDNLTIDSFMVSDGKQDIQLIAAFKDKDMKLSTFGQPVDTKVVEMFENRGAEGTLGSSTASRTDDIYATDASGRKYKLEVPADAKAFPVTTFETGASKDSTLTVKLPALIATYTKPVDSFRLSIPKDGQKTLNRNIDMVAQKAVAKSIKRISPTSAELVFDLNTGAEKYVSIRSFQVYSKDIKKMTTEFSGDKAVMTLEFDKDVNAADLEISYPEFVMNGNWKINMK